MPYHFRFTPYDLVFDLIAFCNLFTTCVAGYETKSKFGTEAEPHFHIYIETDMGHDTIVNYAREHLKIPKGQRGKANKWFACKNWNDDYAYFVKYGQVKYQKNLNVTQEKIEEGYNKYIKPFLNDAITLIKKENAGEDDGKKGGGKARQDEWTALFMAQPPTDSTQDWTPINWRQWICKYYIARIRPIPRTGDLMRYSVSLYILRKSKGGQLENILDRECELYVDSLEKKPPI